MDGYRRTVSSEEARAGYLLVEKARRSFFPPEGEPFELDRAVARVESYACRCRGPNRPHRHWFVRVGGLVEGERVELVREASGRFALRRG
jgi:hypothetical protein